MTQDDDRAAARLELKTLSKIGELLAKLNDADAIERVLRYHAERAGLALARVTNVDATSVHFHGATTPAPAFVEAMLEKLGRMADALEAIPQSEHGEIAVCVTGHINATTSKE